MKIIWPYLLRFLAKRSTEYLQERRKQRKEKRQSQEPAESSPMGQAGNVESLECPPAQTGLSAADAVWYTLSGVLLGSALSLILAKILQQDKD